MLCHHCWCWQDNGLCHHWQCWVPSTVHFTWKCLQFNSESTLQCHCANWVSRNTKRSVLFHPLAYTVTYTNLYHYLTAERKFNTDTAFQTFKRRLYHSSISHIFSPIQSAMTTPIVRRCPDSHFHHVIYNFGAFIADYPEQAYLLGIVSGWCPK